MSFKTIKNIKIIHCFQRIPKWKFLEKDIENIHIIGFKNKDLDTIFLKDIKIYNITTSEFVNYADFINKIEILNNMVNSGRYCEDDIEIKWKLTYSKNKEIDKMFENIILSISKIDDPDTIGYTQNQLDLKLDNSTNTNIKKRISDVSNISSNINFDIIRNGYCAYVKFGPLKFSLNEFYSIIKE